MGMFKQFRTDTNLEKQGIWLDYGDFRVRVARAGGANTMFNKSIEHKTKPYRRAIQAETFDRDRIQTLVREAFVDTIVLAWEVNKGTSDDPKWEPGIEGEEEGTVLPYTKENVLNTFKALPDLFTDVQEQAAKSALFRQELREEDVKN